MQGGHFSGEVPAGCMGPLLPAVTVTSQLEQTEPSAQDSPRVTGSTGAAQVLSFLPATLVQSAS